MDTSACRDHLRRLLAEETATLARLETLLEHEHSVIVSQDIDELGRSGIERQSCIGDLMRIEDERRNLCRLHGKHNDAKGLEQLMQWCDPKATLRSQLSECTQRAERCRDANDRNGMLVATRLRRVEGMLNIITGRQGAVTYGKKSGYAPTSSGRMISSQA